MSKRSYTRGANRPKMGWASLSIDIHTKPGFVLKNPFKYNKPTIARLQADYLTKHKKDRPITLPHVSILEDDDNGKG